MISLAVVSTIWETSTVTISPVAVTAPCDAPKTNYISTIRGPPTTIIETQIILEVTVDSKVTSSTATTSVINASCRYSTSSRAVTSSTPRSTTSPSSSRRVTTVTVTTAPPAVPGNSGGGYTFTLSGSRCVLDLQTIAGGVGRGPPWRGGGGRGGPPEWITSLWQGGVPPFLAQGGAIPTWVSCAKIASSTRLRRGIPLVKAAWTSTLTQTSYTETATTTTTIPAPTLTRNGK